MDSAFAHLPTNYLNIKKQIHLSRLTMNWSLSSDNLFLSVHFVGLLISEIILGRRGDCTNPSPRRFYFIIEIFWAEICYLRKIAVVNEREDNCNHYWKGSCYLIKFPKLFCF